MKPSYFHFEIPSGRNHGQADVASSYLATITWCAWYPTWRRNEATWHNVACALEFHPLPPR